jgi:hypothetical protein
MKIRYLAPVVLAVLAGCNAATPTQAPVAQRAPVADCVFPFTNEPAPGWVCDEPVPGLEVTSVGTAEKSAAGLAYMKDIAALDARGKLAENFKTRIEKMVKKYIGTTGIGEGETVDAAASTTVKSVTAETLVGSKIYKSRTASDGRLFVLVGLDVAQTQKAVEQVLQTSMKNDRAMWQQFQAEKSFEEMKQEIAAQQVD